MKVQKSYASVSLREATDLVKSVGDTVTFLFSGEMGIGKSSILSTLKRELGDAYHYCYFDIPTKDVGDFTVPNVHSLDGTLVTSFIPNEEFGFHFNKPVVLMLDEIGKAPRAVLNACLRLILERKLGNNALPEGSLVFATTNLSVEGLGDNIPPHARNRLTQVKIRKPTSMEWIEEYAIPRALNPVIVGTVMEFPQMFESFESIDDPANNNYIFHPKSPRTAFVTPRSLEKASCILTQTKGLSDDVRVHALFGTVGEAAAMDIMTMHRLDEELPAWEKILKDPEGANVPKSAAAACMLVAKACMRVERENFADWMKYANRMTKEAQALFARSIMRGEKRAIAATNRDFVEWASKNSFLFQ